MIFNAVLFNSPDPNEEPGLWETNGTAGGTFEITGINGAANNADVDPQYLTVYGSEVLFEGTDSSGEFGLWVTTGTGATTYEIGGVGSSSIPNANPTGLGPGYFADYNGEVLFRGEAGVAGDDVPGLWITNGTAAGTFEIGGAGNAGIANAYGGGLLPSNPDFTILNGVALFNGEDSNGQVGLWETNGTAAGTFELAPIGDAAFAPGSAPVAEYDIQPRFMTILGGEVLFNGADQEDTPGSLWETNGTAAGTVEIGGQGNAGIAGSPDGFTGQFTSELPLGIQPNDLTTYGSEVLFAGFDSTLDSGGYYEDTDALWMTNGTASGTVEIGGLGNAGIANINPASEGGIFWNGSIEYPDFTVYNGIVLFVGYDKDGHVGLWETNGTATGTFEIGGLNNGTIGLHLNDSSSPDFTLYNGEVLFNGLNSSNQSTLWITNGTAAGTKQVGTFNLGQPNAILGPDFLYAALPNPGPPAGTTADMIMNNPSNGDYEIYNIGGNAILAAYSLGQVGSPWSFVGMGTFQAGDTDDMLLRNTSTGGFEAYYISNNNITGATLVGTVGTNWNFAGTGNFDGQSSLSELLLRNSSSGSFELYQVAGGGVLSGSSVAAVGNNFTVKGFGFFSESGATQMMMQGNSGATLGQLELYTYQPSTASFAGIDVGKVGSNLTFLGCADLVGNGSTQMVMQQNNSDIWLYSYNAGSNTLSGTEVGAIGSNFHVVGFGPLGTSGQDEMLMQDAAGDFEVYQYNAGLNAFVGTSMGKVGAPWVVDGIAANAPSAAAATALSSAQLVQAMASIPSGTSASAVSSPATASALETPTPLTTPHA